MTPTAAFKPFGALAVGVLAAGLTFLALHWPQGLSKTFSQHAAASRTGVWYYIGLFAVVLPLLLLFLVGWFAPARHVAKAFDVFVILSALLQFSVTLVPETGGWRTPWHRLLTFFSAVLMLPALALVGQVVRGSERAVVLVCLAIMCGVMVFAGKHQNGYAYALLLQIFYYAAFFAAVLWVAYA